MKLVQKFLLLVVIGLTGCSAMPKYKGVETEKTLSPGGYFEFQVSPWVSLHHFAYHLSRENAKDRRLRGRVPIGSTDELSMSNEFRTALQPVFDAYEPYIEEDLLFGDDLSAIGRTLSFEGPDGLADAKIARALKTLMPIYYRDYWNNHQALNQSLLLQLMPLLEKHEIEMATSLAAAVENSWGQEPIRTDLSIYANWAGAYTDNGPNRITMSATDPEITNGYAFEILFHEALHSMPLGEKLHTTINKSLTDAGVDNPRIWHDVLFYISGKATGNLLGITDYSPYAEYAGIVERKQNEYAGIDQAWNEDVSFEEKATRLASILKQTPSD